jgi:hypothetical protein
LMSLIEMVFTEIREPRIHYVAKKYMHMFNIPNAVTAVPRTTFLRVIKTESVNKTQVERTSSRL